MTTIYQANPDDFIGKVPIERLLKQLPKSMHARANRYRFEKDAYAFVLGRLLLKMGLAELNLSDDLDQISIDENGKPTLRHCFFNISHTKGMIVCAISNECEIGIDVELMDEVDLLAFEDWFTKMEWKDIHDAKNSLDRFYWYWTRKESIIKALGMKLSELNKLLLDKDQDSFIENDKEWFIETLDFNKKYRGSLCSSVKNKTVFSKKQIKY